MIDASKRVTQHFLLLAILLGITLLVYILGGGKNHEASPEESALALGFLLLFAFIIGRVGRNLGAPLITGFLIAGVIAGPDGIGLITDAAISPLKLVNMLALSLIAFSAGGELKINHFRARIKAFVGAALAQTGVTLAVSFIILTPVLYMSGLVGDQLAVIIAASVLLSVISTANSPATAIAVISETRANGPVSETVIGVTVFKDVIVILLFGFAVAFARAITGSNEAGFGFILHIIFDLGFSFFLGGIIGFASIAYLKYIGENIPLFLVGMAFVIVELCAGFNSSPLLMSIMAGFVVENASKEGERLMDGLRTSSLPIFIIFFSLAGLSFDMEALQKLWPYAILMASVRAFGIWKGTTLGLSWAGESKDIGKHAWTGFIGQAGVSLGLAVIVAEEFGAWGAAAATLILSSLVINQLIGPAIMKRSLVMAGETNQDDSEEKGK